MAFHIVADGSCDLRIEEAKALNVEVVPFFVSMDGENYQKEVVEIPTRDIYQFMVDNPGKYPKTAQPSIEDYLEKFEKCAAAGEDIICFALDHKLSGSYNAALLAKQMMRENGCNVRIEVIDTLQATVMQTLMIRELASYRDAGAEFEEAVQMVLDIRDTSRIFFTVHDLDYLIHGGRVGKLAGAAANVLNLCPMIILSDGDLNPAGLARGRKQARKKALQMAIKYIQENGNDPTRFAYIIGYGYDIEEGELMKEALLEELDKNWSGYCPEVDQLQIDATIGVHTGPYPVGYGVVERWQVNHKVTGK